MKRGYLILNSFKEFLWQFCITINYNCIDNLLTLWSCSDQIFFESNFKMLMMCISAQYINISLYSGQTMIRILLCFSSHFVDLVKVSFNVKKKKKKLIQSFDMKHCNSSGNKFVFYFRWIHFYIINLFGMLWMEIVMSCMNVFVCACVWVLSCGMN